MISTQDAFNYVKKQSKDQGFFCPNDYAEAVRIEANLPLWIRKFIAIRYR